MDQNKKIILIVVAILVIAGFGYWGFKKGLLFNKKPSSTANVGNSIKQVPGGKLPADMPADIILPKDAKIINSYTGITPSGEKQSTVIFSTAEDPATIFKDYETYFGKNGWAQEFPPSLVQLKGKNTNGQELNISTSQDKRLNLVSITLLSPNAK